MCPVGPAAAPADRKVPGTVSRSKHGRLSPISRSTTNRVPRPIGCLPSARRFGSRRTRSLRRPVISRRSRTIATTCHAVRKRLPFGPTNSATGPPPLEGPGSARCSRSTRPGCGRRNCNVDLNNLRWDRPDLDCEPQQARVIPRNLQVDETGCVGRWRIRHKDRNSCRFRTTDRTARGVTLSGAVHALHGVSDAGRCRR